MDSLNSEKYKEITKWGNLEKVLKGIKSANNQGIKIGKGKYILLLNPDTVIDEQTLTKITERMNADDQICGLVVRMVDGKGVFLPESKRGLPTPMVAFYKIFGLSSIFKK